MKPRHLLLAAIVGGALTAVAGEPAPKAPAPDTPAPAAPTAADGEKIWNEKASKCATCHGTDGKGDTKMGKSKHVKDMTSAEWQKSKTDEDIENAILKGVEREEDGKKVKMSPLKNGTPEQAKALLAFIRSLGAK